MPTINMRTRSRAKVHHRPRNILRSPQPLIRRRFRQALRTSLQLHEAVRHLGREEARCQGVAEDALRAELDSEIAGEVQGGGFGSAVGKSCVLAQGADTDACDGGGDDYAGGIFDGGASAEEGSESGWMLELVGTPTTFADALLYTMEHALDVQIHDLAERVFRRPIERRSPRCSRVREQDINMLGMLRDLLNQALDLGEFGDVGWDRYGFAGARQGV